MQSGTMTIEEVMQELSIGRKKATALVNTKGCPILPRNKGEKYIIPRQAFYAWLEKAVQG